MTQRLKDWNVTLKMHASPNGGTRIFKESVRFVFGKKDLRDDEIESLKALQDAYYRCKIGRRVTDLEEEDSEDDSAISFWISLEMAQAKKKLDEWTVDRHDIRYLRIKNRDVAFVRASDECLRDEIRKNGGKSLEERRKRKKVESPVTNTESPQPSQHLPEIVVPRKTFALGDAKEIKTEALKDDKDWIDELKNRALVIAEAWVCESTDWTNRFVKRGLVEKLAQDLEAFLDQNRSSVSYNKPAGDAYDRYREDVLENILVGGVNRMGNAMVQWYEEQTNTPSFGTSDVATTCTVSQQSTWDSSSIATSRSLPSRCSQIHNPMLHSGEQFGWEEASVHSNCLLSRLDSESFLSGLMSELDESTSFTHAMHCDDSMSFTMHEGSNRDLNRLGVADAHPPACVVIHKNAPEERPPQTATPVPGKPKDAGRQSDPNQTFADGCECDRRVNGEAANDEFKSLSDKVEDECKVRDRTFAKYIKRQTASAAHTAINNQDGRTNDGPQANNSSTASGSSAGRLWAFGGGVHSNDRLSIRSKGRARNRTKWLGSIAEDSIQNEKK